MTRAAGPILSIALTSLCLLLSPVGLAQSTGARASQTFEFESYIELLTLTDSLGYTPEAWSGGSRSVPRLYLTEIPQRWRNQMALEVSVEIKKQLFFQLLLPAVLSANEMILRDRNLAIDLITRRGSEEGLSAAETVWLRRLARRYGLTSNRYERPDSRALADLLTYHLLPIPVSLVMAQAAEESGWGTSRFATEGNALFGQWAWSGSRIRPTLQRAELGDYGVAAFAAPLQSIVAYMRNLNTHAAYTQLRARRAELLERGSNVSGWTLAETLTRYSERGQEYIDTVHTIMHFNDLASADEAYLDSGPSIFLVPTGLAAE